MKDPRRLLEGDGTEEQRALLRAGALEEPTREGRARLLAALGVTAASASEPTAQAQSTATGGLTAGSSAASATSATSAIKLAVLALGSAALLAAGAMLWPRVETPETTETPAGRDAPASSGKSAELPRDDQARDDQARDDQPRDDQPRDGQAAHNAEPKGSVALEVEAIERVRSELGREDGQAALTALRRYASAHPRGVLAHEADVLRVEALLQKGDAPAALELAQQLLRRQGDSPHRARLEALARRASAPSEP